MRNRNRIVIESEKEKLIDEALERVYNGAKERETEPLRNKNIRNWLWWREFLIIIAPISFWFLLLFGVLIYWPEQQVIIQLPIQE